MEEICKENNIELIPIGYARKSKYTLETEQFPIEGGIVVDSALGTVLYDNRDLSSFYFEDEEDANEFLKYYKAGSPRWAVECLFEGYEGEPDYSSDGIVNNISEFTGKGKSFQTLFRKVYRF